jgi:polyhydroxybutyrate depolymerase
MLELWRSKMALVKLTFHVLLGSLVSAVLSACGGGASNGGSIPASPPGQTATAARDFSSALTSGSLVRTYGAHVPAKADSTQLIPLVIVLHGGSGTGAGMRDLTGLDAQADKNSFVVAYPDGYLTSWADGRGTTDAEKAGVDDVAFISSLIDQLAKDTPIDLKRVYVTGISNGGMMSIRLACDLSNKIVAVAPVAANMPQNLTATCKPARPVPIMFVHGNADTLVPRAGGAITVGAGGIVLSTPDSVAWFNAINGCAASSLQTTIIDTVSDGTSINFNRYTACAVGGETRFYDVVNGGHTWPGGKQYLPELIIGKTSADMSASAEMVAFFKNYHF